MAFHPNSTFNLQCASSAYISRQCTGSPLKHLLFIALHLIENDSISFFFDPLWWFFICPTARNVSTTENVCQSYRACRPVCVYRNDENLKQDEEKAWMVKIQK